MGIRLILLGGLLALVFACSDTQAPSGAKNRPDVVLILIDTLRPDRLAFYGNQQASTPFLDGLASQGVVFERAFSTSSWTAPATASVMTGLYFADHGITQGVIAHPDMIRQVQRDGEVAFPINRLPEDVPLLSEVFRGAGYLTFGAATNPNIGPAIGFVRGFDYFEYEPRNLSAEELFVRISSWRTVMQAAEQPFFLYLHLNDVHLPYEKREPWYEPDIGLADELSAYDSQIAYLDRQLAKYLGGVDVQDAVIVLVSDHGEEFGEHGGRHHEKGLFQELNRILLSIRAPGLVPRRVAENVSLIDVLPTVLELADIENLNNGEGWSLAPLMRGDEPAPRQRFSERVLFAHRAGTDATEGEVWWAAINGHWKLIEDSTGRALFNHVRDNFEKRNVILDQPQRAADLGQALDAYQARPVRDTTGAGAFSLDVEMIEELRSLGYVE